MSRLMRKLAGAVVVVTGLAAAHVPGAAQASPILDRVVQSGTLRVGMSGSQPPFTMLNRSGQLMGLDVDLARALASALQVEFVPVTRPFGELLPALERGEVDVVISGMSITARRSQRVSFVGPYLLSGTSLLTTEGKVATLQAADSLNHAGLKLAVLRNSTSQAYVERNLSQAQVTAVEDYDAGIKLVIDGRVDAMLADMPVTLVAVMRNPDAGLRTLNQPLTIEPIGIAMARNDPAFQNLVRNYLWALQGTGFLEEVRKKWMEDGAWMAALP